MVEKVIKIRINLEGKNKEMFEKIKEKYNLSTNTETIRLIIKSAYENEFSKD